jgi:hypothetical protein
MRMSTGLNGERATEDARLRNATDVISSERRELRRRTRSPAGQLQAGRASRKQGEVTASGGNGNQ